jgi:hypothetical protein
MNNQIKNIFNLINYIMNKLLFWKYISYFFTIIYDEFMIFIKKIFYLIYGFSQKYY